MKKMGVFLALLLTIGCFEKDKSVPGSSENQLDSLSFTEPIQLSDPSCTVTQYTLNRSTLGIDNNSTVYVAWPSTPGADGFVCFSKIENGLASKPEILSYIPVDSENDADNPIILMDSQDRPHLLWHDSSGIDPLDPNKSHVIYQKTLINGAWIPSLIFSTYGIIDGFDAVMDQNDNIHLLINIGLESIVYSSDSPELLGSVPLILSPEDVSYVDEPIISIDGVGNILAVWQQTDFDEENPSHFCYSSSLTEANWSPYQILLPIGNIFSYGLRTNQNPGILFYWEDSSAVYFSMFQNDLWSNATQLSVNIYSVENDPDFFLANDGTIHLVWSAHERSDSSDLEIFYSYFKNGAWLDPPINISKSPNLYSESPRIKFDNQGVVHVIWYESSNGIDNIFYSRSL